MARVVVDAIRGVPQSPSAHYHGTEEVTPTRVGICAEGHPRHRGCLRSGRDGPPGRVPPVPIPGRRRGNTGAGVTCLPVKQAGLVLPDPTKTAPKKNTASCVITGHLVAALRGQEDSITADNAAYMSEGEVRGEEYYHLAIGGGTGGYPGGFPSPSCTPLAAVYKEGGMADDASVNS